MAICLSTYQNTPLGAVTDAWMRYACTCWFFGLLPPEVFLTVSHSRAVVCRVVG